MRLHHAKALKTAKPLADDFSYIVYEADNIAAAADRREREDEGLTMALMHSLACKVCLIFWRTNQQTG